MAEERITPDLVSDHNIIEYKEHLARYEFASTFIKKGNVGLDIACGSGYGTQMLFQQGASIFYGVDISSEAIQYAKTHYENNQVKFIQSDATAINFPNQHFDIIVSFETIEHLTEERGMEFIKVLSGLLKKEGYISGRLCEKPLSYSRIFL